MERNKLQNYLENIYTELNAIYEGTATNDDGEQTTFYDYFQDALDYEYTIGADGSYLGVRVYVTLGGQTYGLIPDGAKLAARGGRIGRIGGCRPKLQMRLTIFSGNTTK